MEMETERRSNFVEKYVCLGLLAICMGCTEGYIRKDYDFQKTKRIAIIDVTGDLSGEATKNQVSDFFTMELLDKGYAPIARAGVQKILKEQKFQASKDTPEEDAARAGEILNVPAVLLINVSQSENEIDMTAKMMDVETGEILWISNGNGRADAFWPALFGAGAGAAAGSAVAGKHNKGEGAVVGAIIGGMAGYELAPKTARRIRNITRKMCRTLPSPL